MIDPYIPGSPGGEMNCPRCGRATKDDWKPLQTTVLRDDRAGGEVGLTEMFERGVPLGDSTREFVTLDWMRCEWEDCLQTVIRGHETRVKWYGSTPIQNTNTQNLYPPSSGRPPASSLVPESIRRDYDEAGAILVLSHRMAAVLARKIISDLLKRYAGRKEKRLTAQIDQFLSGPEYRPSAIADGLHHVREAADMSAHTQEEQVVDEDTEPIVVEIDYEEAEWTLDFVERLFDYFIVQPEKDKEIKARIEDKGARAGRKALRSDSEGGE